MLDRRRVPNANVAVVTSGDEARAIWGKAETADALRMPEASRHESSLDLARSTRPTSELHQ